MFGSKLIKFKEGFKEKVNKIEIQDLEWLR